MAPTAPLSMWVCMFGCKYVCICILAHQASLRTLIDSYTCFSHYSVYRCDILSLLGRGWVLAYTHVRGGGECGQHWHHHGRLHNKHRSFDDLVVRFLRVLHCIASVNQSVCPTCIVQHPSKIISESWIEFFESMILRVMDVCSYRPVLSI